MTLLSPSSSSRRRGATPVVVAVIGALAIGIGAGWFFAGRDKGTPVAAGPTTSSTCTGTAKPTGSATGSAVKSPSGTAKPSGTARPSGKPAAIPLPSAITVNVYNATTRKGLAKATSVELAARGFRTGKVSNDPSKKIIAASAEVRFGPAGAVNAKVVAAQVVGAVLVPDNRRDATVDFVLGEGFAALATVEQANATIALLTAPSPAGC